MAPDFPKGKEYFKMNFTGPGHTDSVDFRHNSNVSQQPQNFPG